MRINLKQIEAFRAIMLTGSVSRAADLLNVSQPAVSRLLAYTEQRLGMPLFERIKGRLYPTPEAKRLLTEVNYVYQGVQRVNEVADDLIENRSGSLRIACSPSLGQGLLPRAIAKFLNKYPDARVSLATLRPHVLSQALLTQQADLGVAFLAEAHPNLKSELLYSNRLVAAIPANHWLTGRNEVSLSELAAESFIGYGPETPIGQFVRHLYEAEGLSVRFKVEVQQVHVACALVQAGVGVALIDEITPMAPIWTRVAIRRLHKTVDTPIHVLRPAFEPLSRLAHAFVETLEEMKIDWAKPKQDDDSNA